MAEKMAEMARRPYRTEGGGSQKTKHTTLYRKRGPTIWPEKTDPKDGRERWPKTEKRWPRISKATRGRRNNIYKKKNIPHYIENVGL